MSIYSGFATRQQEGFYNKLIEKSFQLMSSRLISFFRGDSPSDDLKWARQLRKLFKYMVLMEKTKYLAPKYSEHIEALAVFIKDHLVSDTRLIDKGVRRGINEHLEHFDELR